VVGEYAGLVAYKSYLTHLLSRQIRSSEQRIHQQLAEIKTLFNTTTAFTSSLELDEVLHCIAEQMALALNATSCYVSEWNLNEGTWTELAECVSPQAAPQERMPDMGTTYYMKDYTQLIASLSALEPTLIRVSDPTCDMAPFALTVPPFSFTIAFRHCALLQCATNIIFK